MKKLLSFSALTAIIAMALVIHTSSQVANIQPSRTIIIPSSMLPVYNTPSSPFNRFILLDTNSNPFTNYTITVLNLGTFLGNILATNNTFISNSIPTIVQLAIPNVIEQGYIFPVVTSNTQSNTFWLDFGVTNAIGQKYIYAALTATNDTYFYGVTNQFQWSILSFNVLSTVSPFARVTIPTNILTLLNTNYGVWNFFLSNQNDVLYLSNGHALRMTFESNNFLENQWLVK